MKDDKHYMHIAIELAKKGYGYVSPNPLVGALIVKNDEIISEGYHEKFGEAHAEVNAIRKSKLMDFSDCTLYVTLEPCSHTGKTPPCVDGIIMAKFKKVVIGMIDPNPLVAGKGIQKLKKAGIEVVVGVLEEEYKELNKAFIKFITTNSPYILLKIAQTIDGFIATNRRNSKWITCEESRKDVHKLRAMYDVVLIGSGTVLADNPSLTVRDVDGRHPMRVILDNQLTLPLTSNLYNDEFKQNTIVVCDNTLIKSKKAVTLKLAQIKILGVSKNEFGQLNLSETFSKLATEFNIASIMVEGGSKVYSSIIKENLFDEIRIYIAPKIFGNGLNSFSELNVLNVKDAPMLKFISNETIGDDIVITAKPIT